MNRDRKSVEKPQKGERTVRRKKSVFVLAVVILIVLAVGSVSWAEETKKININQASVEELTQLKKIGPSLAQRIVDYREQVEPFKSPEDIMKVKGIGEKIFEVIKDHITVM